MNYLHGSVAMYDGNQYYSTQASFWGEDKWLCWSPDCGGKFQYGAKECGVCGREQSYPEIKPGGPLCIACHVRLSEYLDAYYGKNPIRASQCSKCRK